jgi:hypothetical protein
MTIGKLLAAVEGKSAKTCSCTNFGIFLFFFSSFWNEIKRYTGLKSQVMQ